MDRMSAKRRTGVMRESAAAKTRGVHDPRRHALLLEEKKAEKDAKLKSNPVALCDFPEEAARDKRFDPRNKICPVCRGVVLGLNAEGTHQKKRTKTIKWLHAPKGSFWKDVGNHTLKMDPKGGSVEQRRMQCTCAHEETSQVSMLEHGKEKERLAGLPGMLQHERAKLETEAADWYRAAAIQGHAEAQYRLGMYYLEGRGVRRSTREAVRFLERAGETVAAAALLLGRLYADGSLVEKNVVMAIGWLRKAQDLGHPGAEKELKSRFQQEVAGRRLKVGLLQQQAASGDVDAKCKLAALHFEGQGVQKDEPKAFQLYKEAAVGGQLEAMCCVGLCYLSGRGVKSSVEEGKRWVMRAAYLGHGIAQLELAEMYENNMMIEDEEERKRWKRKCLHPQEAILDLRYIPESQMCPVCSGKIRRGGDDDDEEEEEMSAVERARLLRREASKWLEGEATKFLLEEAKPQGGKIRVKTADMIRAIATMSDRIAESMKFAAQRTIASQLVRRYSQKRYIRMVTRQEFIPNAFSSGIGLLRLENACKAEFEKLGRMRGGGETNFSLAELRMVEEEARGMASTLNSSSSASSAPAAFSALPDLLSLCDQRDNSWSGRQRKEEEDKQEQGGEEPYLDIEWKKHAMEKESEMLRTGDAVEILVRFDRGSQALFADSITRHHPGMEDVPVFSLSRVKEWQEDLFRTAETMAALEAKDVKNQDELLEEKITQEEFLSRRELIFKRIELNRRHKAMLQSKVSSALFEQQAPTAFTQSDVKAARESLNRIRGEVVEVLPGDADAQLELGFRFAEGKGAMRDNFKAVKWMKQAVEQDHPLAHCALAIMLATGRGVPCVDREAAMRHLQRAADANVAIAETFLMDLERSKEEREWRQIPREVDRIRNVLCKEADENRRTKAFPIATHRSLLLLLLVLVLLLLSPLPSRSSLLRLPLLVSLPSPCAPLFSSPHLPLTSSSSTTGSASSSLLLALSSLAPSAFGASGGRASRCSGRTMSEHFPSSGLLRTFRPRREFILPVSSASARCSSTTRQREDATTGGH